MVNPILVVEDDRKIANIVKVYLEGAGFRVVHAERGRDAIDIALKEMPLLVILDLKLPDISGEEVCQELKEIGDFPIIMLTSKALEEERIVGFALGADDYVTKPFSPKELVYRVKAVLKRAVKDDLDTTRPVSFNDGLLIRSINIQYKFKCKRITIPRAGNNSLKFHDTRYLPDSKTELVWVYEHSPDFNCLSHPTDQND